MRSTRTATILAVALALGLAAGCGSDSGPSGPIIRQPGDLTVLRIARAAPPLWNTDTVITCVKGQGCDGRIFFQDTLGGKGEEFARLTLDGASLLRRPDGTTINVGDTIAITMSIVGDSVMLQFAPNGLRFDPAHPAKLAIKYGEAGDSIPSDFDGDGTVGDGGDKLIESLLSFWKEELPGDPFLNLGGSQVSLFDDIEVDINGFTRFALAY